MGRDDWWRREGEWTTGTLALVLGFCLGMLAGLWMCHRVFDELEVGLR